MPDILHLCLYVKASFYSLLTSQLSALIVLLFFFIVLLLIKTSVYLINYLIYLNVYCVPVDIRMTKRNTCPLETHSVQVE